MSPLPYILIANLGSAGIGAGITWFYMTVRGSREWRNK